MDEQMADIIYTDRSRIETAEKCQRKRYWQIEYQGRGLERSGDLKLDARIGTWCHNGIERRMAPWEMSDDVAACALWAANEFLKECWSLVDRASASPQVEHDIVEGAQIVIALVYAWLKTTGHRVAFEGEVLAIERELTTDFAVPTSDGSATVRLMSRPDIIWRRHQDGTIFIRNLKATRRADDKFREKWALDQQTLSEPLAVDAWLQRHTEPPLSEGAVTEGGASAPYDSLAMAAGRSEGSSDEASHRLGEQDAVNVCGGVIIDGLVTGEVLWDKYRGMFYHNNPLIYCWKAGDIGVTDKPEYYAKYEWSCTGPHKFANGRKCEGGRTHKLSGVTKVSVADHYPGGIVAWIDYLIANQPDVIAEMIVELPPIIRSEYQIERWKRQTLAREADIKRWAAMADAAEGLRREQLLDSYFPMSTSNGNCLYPSKCMAFDCCHGSSASDPLNAGYQPRQPNHSIEVVTGSESMHGDYTEMLREESK